MVKNERTVTQAAHKIRVHKNFTRAINGSIKTRTTSSFSVRDTVILGRVGIVRAFLDE